MTRNIITPIPLNATDFISYGDVISATGNHVLINDGWCKRFSDRANLDFESPGRAGISMFSAKARRFPYSFDLIERHPEGSQAFLPMTQNPFLVIVAAEPEATPIAFITDGTQSVNFHRGTWHGVLTPLSEPGLFAVVDRIGPGKNLEEFRYSSPWTVIDYGLTS